MPSFDQFIKDWEAAEKSMIPTLIEGENASIEEAHKLARRYSSGEYPQEWFDVPTTKGGMGHVYAKNRSLFTAPIPYGDPSIINKQTGAFKAAWTKVAASWSIDTISSALLNFNKAAAFLKWGTRFMIARPIDEKVIKQVEPVRMANLAKAANKIFGKFR